MSRPRRVRHIHAHHDEWVVIHRTRPGNDGEGCGCLVLMLIVLLLFF